MQNVEQPASAGKRLYLAAPPVWRALLAELDGRPLDGTPFVRDVDAICDVYEPIEIAMHEDGNGTCETDGHYLCAEGTSVCKHISEGALRRRRDRCEDCGTPLERSKALGEHCPACDVIPMRQEAGSAPERP